MSKETLRVVIEIIETVMKKSDALSGATDTLPPLMSNLKIEKKTDDPSGRQEEEEEEEEEQDSSEYAESLLDFLHEPTVDFVNEACDTEEERHRAMKSICRLVASLESEAARDLEEFEASIPENPQEWTREMSEYMYEKEKEEVRNFEEQQLALEKKKRIQKRLDKTYRRRRKIAKKTSKRERECSSGLA
ncbi:unnamed protein product [Prunus armeniaca]|uniref:Uncharacterized protein n=1 Tax=Prunus armeniaca TaxID=36596 RepID=A0A6J5YBP7_PRUAR|nr:unnamed protein product [Prunus armeniaca]